jgi:hypothetical protein
MQQGSALLHDPSICAFGGRFLGVAWCLPFLPILMSFNTLLLAFLPAVHEVLPHPLTALRKQLQIRTHGRSISRFWRCSCWRTAR